MARKSRNPFIGVVFGAIMLVVLTVILFNNEGRSVNRIRALENVDNAMEIQSTDTSVADGSLILFSDETSTNEIIIDEVFGISAPDNALKLKREVMMYQWVEIDENDEDETGDYRYTKEWREGLVDSDGFYYVSGHENPKNFPYESNVYEANSITIGSYTLDYAFKHQLNNYRAYENMPESSIDGNTLVLNDAIYIASAIGKGEIDPNEPQIGDIKIEFSYVPTEITTVLGEKSGSNLVAYNTKNGNLAEVEYGRLTKESLKAIKLQKNKTKTWAIRIGCIIGMMVAIGMIFSPLTNLLGRIPILGNIINGGFMLIGSVLGTAWGIIVIAVGWIYYRPVLGILLIVAVVAGIISISKVRKDKNENTGYTAA